MSESKHTPGPWVARRATAYENLEPLKCITIDAPGWGAFTLIAVEMDSPGDTAQGLANARLIAAAPDMLALIKEVLFEAEHHHTGCEPGPWKRMPQGLRAAINRSRHVIAKAEGKS